MDETASVVLSETLAERYFGKTDPVGRQLLIDKTPYRVTGVFIKDATFHLQFDYLLPVAALQLPAERLHSWGWHQFYNYVKLKEHTDVAALQAKFQHYVKQYARRPAGSADGADIPYLQALKDIHLHAAGFKFDAAQRGNITYVHALLWIAAFVLLIACFNFINLATARSLQRAKEVGVRKTMGAAKRQLMLQFVGETALLAFVSIVLSAGITLAALPWLNQFTGKQIGYEVFLHPATIAMLAMLLLLVGMGAGFYPAMVLARFRPAKVLKGAIAGDGQPGKMAWLRHGLVVVQFSLSVLLIISALVVFKQVDYLHHKDLGFNKEQIMFFPMRGDRLFANTASFKNELLQVPGVAAVSVGYGFPGDAVAGDEIIVNQNGTDKTHPATQLMVNYDYIKTLGLQVVAGRAFSEAMPTDKDAAFMINEKAVQELGFGTPQSALGQTLKWHVWNDNNPDSLKTGKVIGVVKDFHYKSLYDKVETTVLQIFPDAAWKVAVKIKTAGMGATIQNIKRVWDTYSPDYHIEYKFLDDNFEAMYGAEEKLRTLLWIFAAIAVFVGCLSLFGLAAYTAETRRKEVGIRKVLGATPQGLVVLLSKHFVGLVVIALLIASPVAYYVMYRWLQDFAYRINIGWSVFAIAACMAVGIAMFTVGFQAIKAALANPVKSLRTE